ncbi:hypothetical protein [Variovorax sp. dw_954]|uniref:phage tail tip fiber protein n=1 Tax=Variovorax sp. dw_954 TaxID=2720078 RepID=UPI001BD234E8|nr:hypothetical protein [Variovorax sp. dw_954]
MSKYDSRKSVPGSKSSNFLDSMRETVQTYLGLQGDRLDRGVTLRDLASVGLIDVSKTYLAGGRGNPIADINTIIVSPGGGGTVVIPGITYEPDLTPPPTPTGFVATAGISFIVVECDPQTYTQGHGHAITNLYGAKVGPGALPTFANAVLLASFGGTVYAYPTEPNTEWRLWIKWETKDAVESVSPAGGTNGLSSKTGQNVANLLNALSIAARDNASPYARIVWRADQFYMIANDIGGTDAPVFSVVATPMTVGGVNVPVGTYIRDGFIMNGTITNAKIANLAVDNAKIASMSVDKLLAGSIAVGQYIQSSNYVAGTAGFRLNYLGNVELNNAVLRGSAFIGAGSAGGIIIDSNRIRSANYDGAGNGFALRDDGTLDLPGGSVSANMLNIGTGANLLPNSQWVDTSGYNNSVPTGWGFGYNEPAFQFVRTPDNFVDWCPAGMHGVDMWAQTGPSNNVMYMWVPFPVFPGRRYEVSVYAGAHRCNVYTDIEWHDGFNNVISYSADNGIGNNQEAAGGRTLSNFKRIGCFGVAPNNAATGYFRIIKNGTQSGGDSHAFLVAPYAGAAQPRQTTFSPYSPSGVGTRITPQGITTPSLQALTGVMGDLYAGSVRGGSYGPSYSWPGDGGGGFYLGPAGLLLGNGNTGRYFQVEAGGNVYAPGFNCVNGVLSIWQGNVINSGNIVQGAVTFGQNGGGNNSAHVYVNVPGGEVWTILLVGSCGPSNQVPFAITGDISNAKRHFGLTNSPIGEVIQAVEYNSNYTAFGPVPVWQFSGGSTLTSTFQVGGGSYDFQAYCNYEAYGFNTTVSLTAIMFKR